MLFTHNNKCLSLTGLLTYLLTYLFKIILIF